MNSVLLRVCPSKVLLAFSQAMYLPVLNYGRSLLGARVMVDRR